MSKYIIIIFLFFSSIINAQQPHLFPAYQQNSVFTISWYDRPVNFQLFPRQSNDSGNVVISGNISNDGYWDTCLTKLYRSGVLTTTRYQVLSYPFGSSNFSITNKVKAEKQEYTLRFYLRRNGTDSLLYTADSLVSGDVYLVSGQSNMQYSDTSYTINFSNEWMRTFGIQTDSMNYSAYSAGDTLWRRSNSYIKINSIANNYPLNVGAIGQFLQKSILDSFNIPTCVINGSMLNTSIRSHTRNNSSPTSFSTLYGKTLYRIQKAKLQNNIKAILWFQGESDMTSTTGDNNTPTYGNPRGVAGTGTYATYFDSLYKAWVLDYDFQKVFVYQMRQVEGGVPATYQSVMREVQRQFLTTYNDTVQIIPTFGIGGRNSDNIHYDIAGYKIASEYAFLKAKKYFYNSVDTLGSTPPSIRKAFYTSSASTTIGILFNGSNPVGIPIDTLSQDIEKNFYLNGTATQTATSLTLSNDTLYLTMPVLQTATTISYLPPQKNHTVNTSLTYNGAFIRNSRGLAVLGFNGVAIENPPAPDTANWTADSKALFAKMHLASSTITTADKWTMDSLIVKLKADNIWTGWDAMFIMSARDTNAAKISWVTLDSNYTFIGTGVNNLLPNVPTFSSFRGYKNEKIDSVYLKTNVTPSMLYYFKKDSGTVLGWSGDEYQPDTTVVTGNVNNNQGSLFATIDSNSTGVKTINFAPLNYFGANYNLGHWNNLITSATAFYASTTSKGMYSLTHQEMGTNDSIIFMRNDTLRYNQKAPSLTWYDIPYPFYLGAANYKNTYATNYFRGRNVVFAIGKRWTTPQLRLFYTHLNWYLNRVGALSDIVLTQPTKNLTAIRTHVGNNGYLVKPYTPPQYTYNGDSLRMYIWNADSNITYLSKSLNGSIWNYFGATSGAFETGIRQNGSSTNWYGLHHFIQLVGSQNQYVYAIQTSTDDGLTWTFRGDTLNDGSKWFGEEHSIFFHPDSNKYYFMVRPQSTSYTTSDTSMIRKISLVKSSDFSSFTQRVLVVPADTTNFNKVNSKDYRKHFYGGQMFTTGPGEYWMYMNIFKLKTIGDKREYNYPATDTGATSNSVWGELMFSHDGDNWRRTNDTNAFIPLYNGLHEIFGAPVVVGDSLFIYTFESKRYHNWINETRPTQYDIWKYSISLAELRKYKR